MLQVRQLVVIFGSLALATACADSNTEPDAGQSIDAAGNTDAPAGDAAPADADLSPDAVQPGDQGSTRDVVINEVHWSGSGGDADDEWIELRNTTGADIDVSLWQIENAGPSGSGTITLGGGTVIFSGGYLVLGNKQGDDTDGNRTSLTGVSDVVVMSLGLTNSGEELILKDFDGTVIDQTPAGAWPAGNSDLHYTMERRDDITGGGYTLGTSGGAWYTWSSLDGTDTTHADASDSGTPGAANTDPGIFDHLSLQVSPSPPSAGVDFTLTMTAYSSTDNSTVVTSYDGTVTVTASSGTLTGDTTGTVIDGIATMTLQNDTVADGVTLTVTDDVYPEITGSVMVNIRPEGDTAGIRDVVINEVNWYGNGTDTADEWIELRNVSGASLNLSGWTIDAAGSAANAVTIASGTVLADGGYLVIAAKQGADTAGMRTSVTGVSNVQIAASLSLANPGEQLILRDVEGTAIDNTPSGGWPAGSDTTSESMERRDDITGGGYTQGTIGGSWYTWNRYGNTDTTSADTADHGTPGAANSDPNATPTPIYTTGFETSDPNFENAGTGTFSNTPPSGTTARTGTGVATVDSITTSYSGREVQSVDCVALSNDTDPLVVSGFAVASTDNGGNGLAGRWRILWFTDASCATPHATTPDSGPITGTGLIEGTYSQITATEQPPAGATHVKLWFQIRDDNGGTNTGDHWALDDVFAGQ